MVNTTNDLIASAMAKGHVGQISMIHQDGAAVWICAERRLWVRQIGSTKRSPAPGGEEFLRLLRGLETFTMELLSFERQGMARYGFENKSVAFPPVDPWKDGELAMVLRKDEKGQVRRFADWVVQVLPANISMQNAARGDGRVKNLNPWYMDWPSRAVVHDAIKVDQPVVLVKLPMAVEVPYKVAYGLELGKDIVDGISPKKLVPVVTVAMPEHWLRRLTATEAARIQAPRAGELVVY